MTERQLVEIDAAAEIRTSSKSARRKVAKEARRAADDLYRTKSAGSDRMNSEGTSGYGYLAYRMKS